VRARRHAGTYARAGTRHVCTAGDMGTEDMSAQASVLLWTCLPIRGLVVAIGVPVVWFASAGRFEPGGVECAKDTHLSRARHHGGISVTNHTAVPIADVRCVVLAGDHT
jgi:hypothetical protein